MRRDYLIMVIFSFASGSGGCDDASSVTASNDIDVENSAALCGDGQDNDGDGAIDCEDAECISLCLKAPIEAGLSDQPIPPVSDVPKPDGDAGNLSVLDWAGFKAAVSYTFDDTQPSQIEHYDALQATGVHMTFFAVNGTAGASDFNSAWTQAVMDGHEIGNHTAHHCHSDLTGCGFGSAAETVEAEIETCSTFITENFGQAAVWTMASPYGDSGWNAPAADYVFLNRSVNNGTVAPNDSSNPFGLPAKLAVGEETADDLNAQVDAVYEDGDWMIYGFHSILPTSSNWYAGVDIESITDSIDHVKSKGDMWADTMANIGAYWQGQKILTEATPKTSGSDTEWTWTLPDLFPAGKYLRVTVDGGTLRQEGRELTWSEHGYYEVALDKGSLTLSLE